MPSEALEPEGVLAPNTNTEGVGVGFVALGGASCVLKEYKGAVGVLTAAGVLTAGEFPVGAASPKTNGFGVTWATDEAGSEGGLN